MLLFDYGNFGAHLLLLLLLNYSAIIGFMINQLSKFLKRTGP